MTTAALTVVSDAPVVVREDVTAAAAEAYVASHPAASTYHRPAWIQVVRRAFGHEAKYLVAQVDDTIVGVLPLVFFRSRLFGRFAASMPFFNYGGILADNPAAERALLDCAIRATEDAGGRHLELRHTSQHFPELAAKRHKVA